MALFKYEALTLEGKLVRGTMDAGTPAEARASLREKGLHAKTMDEAVKTGQQLKNASAAQPLFLSGHCLDLLSGFSRHLSMLLKAGLPLSQALAVLTEQVEDAGFAQVVKDVGVRVREGASLDEALGCHPDYFPELYICVSKAGAASGNLASTLTSVSAYYARQKKLRDKVISALTYPALMAFIGMLVVTFLMAFVVPKVTSVLLEQQRALPWPTEVLLAISGLISNWWWAILIVLALTAVAARLAMRTERVRLLIDHLLLWVPVLGELFRKQAVARWSDTMSSLIASGIPVAQALAVVKSALGNRVLAQDITLLETAVINGTDLSQAL